MGLQELQDRIDELQSELALQRLSRRSPRCSQPLADHMESDVESQSPGMESDPGTDGVTHGAERLVVCVVLFTWTS